MTDCRFLALPAGPFAEVFRRWYPMAVHLLEGLFLGQRNFAELVGQRERLLALGKLSAGLTHELNNPAAAAGAGRRGAAGPVRRHAAQARAAVRGEDRRRGAADPHRAAGGVRRPGRRDRASLPALERSDREDALGDWLEEHGGYPALGPRRRVRRRRARCRRTSTASRTPSRRPSWSRRCGGWRTRSRPRRCWWRSSTAPAGSRSWWTPPSSTRRWTGCRTSRPICTPGLDATLVMLGAKIGPGITVVKDYDRTLPAGARLRR